MGIYLPWPYQVPCCLGCTTHTLDASCPHVACSCIPKVWHQTHNKRRWHAKVTRKSLFRASRTVTCIGPLFICRHKTLKPLKSFKVLTCIRTTSPSLSNWLWCDRTCSISMMAITTSNILPQFPPYNPPKRQSIIYSINIHEPFINLHCRS